MGNSLRRPLLLLILLIWFEIGNNLKIYQKKHIRSHGTYISLIIPYIPEDMKPFSTYVIRIALPKNIPTGNPNSYWVQVLWIVSGKSYMIIQLKKIGEEE